MPKSPRKTSLKLAESAYADAIIIHAHIRAWVSRPERIRLALISETNYWRIVAAILYYELSPRAARGLWLAYAAVGVDEAIAITEREIIIRRILVARRSRVFRRVAINTLLELTEERTHEKTCN